ncbi:hypothetical protein [Pontibacter akesuensis]|uniref:Dolichyl-phosphate-mannose-protein mannosyltransferase n=1 Tax=Pontibacter akesuensis TaxID=388950 RepID=A0A1I7I842_9BACT|nr:hypothetical protein [Pontibacter akesuensis]GHA65643.1 hypothetical protein GCM10007389_18190 [Pontibacter akesuensis]SFU68946.1 hypothetical protein SAMN04487941_1986 [Pontibacter akesuensis]
MDKPIRADFLLLLLFVVTAAIILFRISIHGSGYLTPDSEAYLELAQNLKDGHGFYVLNAEGTERRYFSTWPVGYPVLIYLFSEVSQFNVFLASKVLNLLFLGLGFLLLRHLCLLYAFVLASIYGAYTFMEVYSFTWSEAPFILGLLLLAYLANQVWLSININRNILLICLTCIFLFLVRYVGAFSFGVPALLGLYFAYQRKYKLSVKLFLAALVPAILAGVYLYNNYQQSGFTTGFDRLEAETEDSQSFVLMMLQGLLNEFLIIREFRLSNQPDYLFYFTTVLQLLLMAFVIVKIRRHYSFWQELKNSSFSLACIGIGILYFAAILLLRSVSHFDDLDYRLLSPFSFPVFIGLIYTLATLPDIHKDVVQAKYAVFTLFMISLFLSVPKNFIFSQLQQLL